MPKVVIVNANYPDYENYCPNWIGMKAGLERLGVQYKFVSCRPSLDIAKQISGFKPDLIVYALLDVLKSERRMAEIRKANPQAKIAIWYGDHRDERTGFFYAKCAGYVDALFVTSDGQKDFFKKYWGIDNVYFLPYGCEPITKPIFNKKLAFDFVFIGGIFFTKSFKWRANDMVELKDKHGLMIINAPGGELRGKIYKAMPSIYSSSKVCLDVSHFTDVPGYASIRFFEIPAYMGFSLTKRFPGCEELYPDKVGKVYFDTFEELLHLKEYYLKHEDERKEIMLKGWEHSKKHTYDHRFRKMFSLLGL